MQKGTNIKYYESSSEATLYSFRKVIETGDVTELVYEGDRHSADIDALTVAWFTIYSEFSEIIQDSSAALYFSELKRKTAKQHYIYIIDTLLKFLKNYPEEEIIESLSDFGYSIDTDNLEDSLRKINGQIRRQELQLKDTNKDTGEAMNFDEIVTEMEKFQGYAFDEKKLTVSKFASIVKRHKDNGRRQNKA